MARTFNGSSQYIFGGLSLAPPFTLSLWYYPDNNTDPQTLWWAGTVDSGIYYYLIYRANTGGKPVGFVAGGGQALVDPGIASTGSWNHLLAVNASTTSRTLYVNGASASNGDTSNPTVVEHRFGRFGQAGVDLWANGKIAEPAIWNVALSSADIASLQAGASPLMIKPQNLKPFYSSFAGGVLDYVGGTALTDNTTNADTHPRVYR